MRMLRWIVGFWYILGISVFLLLRFVDHYSIFLCFMGSGFMLLFFAISMLLAAKSVVEWEIMRDKQSKD